MTTISPDDPNLVLSPYCWDVTSTRAMTIQAGAYIRALIDGAPADLAATFDMTGVTTPASVLTYRVNRGQWRRARTAASVPLDIPTQSTSWPSTVLEVIVGAQGSGTARWTTQSNAVKFTGFTSASPIAAVATPARTRRILTLGDSLNQGVRVLGPPADFDPGVAPFGNGDARLGWGYPLADLLNADVGVVGWGGTGLTTSGDDSVPRFAQTWDQLWDGKPRDFTSAPHAIVFMPGTNDSSATNGDVQAASTAILNQMIANTPSTTRIVLVRNWNGIKATAIQAGIAGCNDPTRVSWVDTTAWFNTGDSFDGTHPYGYANTETLSRRLADAIDAVLSTGSSGSWVMRLDGTLVPA